MPLRLTLFLLLLLPLSARAAFDLRRAIYTPADSVEVERLLAAQPKGSDVLYYARHFLGRPYVAHTLEVADPERLVVNLRQLDCTTLVETVLALTATHRAGQRSFADYCAHLERLRYRGGQMNGYISRLHYFGWWIADNAQRGNVTRVTCAQHFTGSFRLNDYYMTAHPEAYRFLRNHPARRDSLLKMERAANGAQHHYLPEQRTRLTAKQLPCVHDGDLLAIVTTKAGLDYSHLGFAVWGSDGLLHLLNASSVYKKVVEDRVTLHDYLLRQRHATGVAVLRLAN